MTPSGRGAALGLRGLSRNLAAALRSGLPLPKGSTTTSGPGVRSGGLINHQLIFSHSSQQEPEGFPADARQYSSSRSPPKANTFFISTFGAATGGPSVAPAGASAFC